MIAPSMYKTHIGNYLFPRTSKKMYTIKNRKREKFGFWRRKYLGQKPDGCINGKRDEKEGRGRV